MSGNDTCDKCGEEGLVNFNCVNPNCPRPSKNLADQFRAAVAYKYNGPMQRKTEYHDGKEALSDDLSPIHEACAKVIEAIEHWTTIGYKNPNDAEVAIHDALTALQEVLTQIKEWRSK